MTEANITAILPASNRESNWINLEVNGRYVASIWGCAEVSIVESSSRLMVTIRDNKEVAGFLHVTSLASEYKEKA